MLTFRQVLLGGLVALLPGQVDAVFATCPASGPLVDIANDLQNYQPARAYCTLRFPKQRQTVTVRGAGATVTQTVATSTTVVNGGTVTSTVTAGPVTQTQFAPFSTITSSGAGTLTITQTNVETSFTSTTTVTTTTTLTRGAGLDAREPTAMAEALSPKARASKSAEFKALQARPSRAIQTVCKCLATGTVTHTSHPTSTVGITATVTNGGDATVTTTTTPISVTTTTVTPFTTITVKATDTTTTTVTTTISSLATASATLTIPASGFDCLSNNDFSDTGIGGCSTNCYCDLRAAGGPGVCNTGLTPAGQQSVSQCVTDDDCVEGAVCAADGSLFYPAGTCVDFTPCLSNYDAETGTFTGKGPAAAPAGAASSRIGAMSAKKNSS